MENTSNQENEEQKEESQLESYERSMYTVSMPNCSICWETIDIKKHLMCPLCNAEWCKQCIQKYLKMGNKCTNCKRAINFKELKPNYGLVRMLENKIKMNQ